MSLDSIELFDVTSRRRIEKAALHEPDFEPLESISRQQAFRIYKAKIFLMVSRRPSRSIGPPAYCCIQCKHQLRVGSLLSWTDRILTLVDRGDLVRAIELALSFYDGTAVSSDGLPATSNALLGLPSTADERQAIVGPRLQEVLSASVKFVFSEDRMHDDTHVDTTGQSRGVDRTQLFETLVDVAVKASIATGDCNFLFEELYERYSSEGIVGIFLDRLEPFILQDQVRSPPVIVSQQLLGRHEERGELAEAEALIWHLDPTSIDIDQATSLCIRHGLYDALAYIYAKALSDFVGPFVALLRVLQQVHKTRIDEFREDSLTSPTEDYFGNSSMLNDERANVTAYKVYSYLADTLVGLSHPNKEPLEEAQALDAKVSLYSFLFSGRARSYPEGSRNVVRTVEENTPEPTYPYLRLLLAFDAEAMLGCLDIAFEDPYLNEEASGRTPDRQQMMLILLEVIQTINESSQHTFFTSADRSTLNIFIARNLPKYSQFIQLAEPTLQSVLCDLIRDEDISTTEDRQLAAEFLLSAFTPSYDQALLDMLQQAGFYRILASIYRSQKAWRKLAEVQIQDARGDPAVFTTLQTSLVGLKPIERQEMMEAVNDNAPRLSAPAPQDLAMFVDRNFAASHQRVLDCLSGQPTAALGYLGALLEPEIETARMSSHVTEDQRLQYVALLCDCDLQPQRIVNYLRKETMIPEGKLLQLLSDKEAWEAIVWLQAHIGRLQESLETTSSVLDEKMELLSTTLTSGDDPPGKMIEQIVGVTRMSITVCFEQSGKQSNAMDKEEVWFTLLSSAMRTVETATRLIQATNDRAVREALRPIFGLTAEILAALTTSSASRQLPFSRLVRRLMGDGKTNTYIQYKDIISTMLDTSSYESDLLRGTSALTSAEVFEHVQEAEAERRKGWRPNVSGVCEACGKPVWTRADPAESAFSSDLVVKSSSGIEVAQKLKGRPSVRRRPSLKGKEPSWIEETPAEASRETGGGSVVVFRGGAICHAACLQ